MRSGGWEVRRPTLLCSSARWPLGTRPMSSPPSGTRPPENAAGEPQRGVLSSTCQGTSQFLRPQQLCCPGCHHRGTDWPLEEYFSVHQNSWAWRECFLTCSLRGIVRQESQNSPFTFFFFFKVVLCPQEHSRWEEGGGWGCSECSVGTSEFWTQFPVLAGLHLRADREFGACSAHVCSPLRQKQEPNA